MIVIIVVIIAAIMIIVAKRDHVMKFCQQNFTMRMIDWVANIRATYIWAARRIVLSTMRCGDLFRIANSPINFEHGSRNLKVYVEKNTNVAQAIKLTYNDDKVLARFLYGWYNPLTLNDLRELCSAVKRPAHIPFAFQLWLVPRASQQKTERGHTINVIIWMANENPIFSITNVFGTKTVGVNLGDISLRTLLRNIPTASN